MEAIAVGRGTGLVKGVRDRLRQLERPTTLQTTPADEIQPLPIRWLWPDRVPLEMLSVLAGPPGVGKSTM